MESTLPIPVRPPVMAATLPMRRDILVKCKSKELNTRIEDEYMSLK